MHRLLCLWLTGLTLPLCAMAQDAPREEADFAVWAGSERIGFERMARELAAADVVVVGELHDHALGHSLQLEILKALHARSPRLALSLEMFERDVQVVLDEYLNGHITEPHFLQAARPWPRYRTDYAPLVEYCRANGLPVIAANAPRRYVNIVSRKGQRALQELPRESRSYLAPLPYSLDMPEAYDRWLDEQFSQQHAAAGAAAASMPSVENLKQSQALWDATMADSILRFRNSRRGIRVIQVNGAGHSDYGHGLVDRLRKANRRLKVKTVSIKPEPRFPERPTRVYDGAADYLILTRPESSPPR